MLNAAKIDGKDVVALTLLLIKDAARRGGDHVRALLEQALRFMRVQPAPAFELVHRGNNTGAE